mmetsp:Transcript_71165/g.179754  ORF Transcript_71165/g.179754 Transcript_71165/m.179754 type:complete len:476 (+) Transcript_71165:76-1503(+)
MAAAPKARRGLVVGTSADAAVGDSILAAGPFGLRQAYSAARRSYSATMDSAFIRSRVNGRQSRRVVLLAFFCADAIGALLWALWCEEWWGAAEVVLSPGSEQVRACGSLGLNHFMLLFVCVPAEGAALFLAGRNPWSFWSDGLLLPLWLVRLGLLDVVLWSVSPKMLLGDALWFSVMAVMCRVHSLALLVLVGSQAFSLYFVLTWRQTLDPVDAEGFAFVHYGVYSVIMLLIMAFAYALDEQSRVSSFQQLTALQDLNAALAEHLLRSKASEPPPAAIATPIPKVVGGGAGLAPAVSTAATATRRPAAYTNCCPLAASSLPAAPAPAPESPAAMAHGMSSRATLLLQNNSEHRGWHHRVLEDPAKPPTPSSSGCSSSTAADVFAGALPLPPPALHFEGPAGAGRGMWPRTTRGGRFLVPTRLPGGGSSAAPTGSATAAVAAGFHLSAWRRPPAVISCSDSSFGGALPADLLDVLE